MELRQYFAVIRKYLWLILLTTVLATGAAFYVSFTAPPVYQATTTLEVNLGASPLSDPYSVSNVRTMESAAEIFAAKIQFPLFLQEVKDRLGLPADVEIEDMIGVQQMGSTQLIRISAESNDPALAQALADTVARVLIEQETSQQQVRFQAGLVELEAQIAALEAAITETQAEIAVLGNPEDTLSEFVRLERSRLESQLTRDQTRLVVLLASAEEFRLAMARYIDTITIYAPAEFPSRPVESRTMQNTLLGAVTGLMIGVGVAFLLEYLDDTIKSPLDVKQTLPTGVLGALPRLKGIGKGTDGQLNLVVAEHPLQPVSEAFRNLRTSIQFSGVDQPVRTLLVTSPLPTEGKTFTAANLAAVMAQGGKSVILVDTDLRRPMVHRVLGLSREPGLTAALLSPDQWATILRETGVAGLRTVTSGSHAPNPAELLASERMQEFVAWLEGQADVVIFDSPPVLSVTDAAVLANLTDGTLLVVDCGETRKPAAAQAVERLTGVGGRVLGVVLNRLTPSRDGYYYYYYYYSGAGDATPGRKRNWITRLLRLGRGKRGKRRGRRGKDTEVHE
ncbi:MAG: polysaccharide biosynthesis tyrosine autokinase [Anaerolineae bacterium]